MENINSNEKLSLFLLEKVKDTVPGEMAHIYELLETAMNYSDVEESIRSFSSVIEDEKNEKKKERVKEYRLDDKTIALTRELENPEKDTVGFRFRIGKYNGGIKYSNNDEKVHIRISWDHDSHEDRFWSGICYTNKYISSDITIENDEILCIGEEGQEETLIDEFGIPKERDMRCELKDSPNCKVKTFAKPEGIKSLSDLRKKAISKSGDTFLSNNESIANTDLPNLQEVGVIKK